MFTPGSILYGFFNFQVEQKNKYAIVLHNDDRGVIITTFTTSQHRGVDNPVHGGNPEDDPVCYVFKAGVPIGIRDDNGKDFAFPLDTTVVSDYGYSHQPIEDFQKRVTNLKKVSSLYRREYKNLLYVLYKCKSLQRKFKPIFEHKLMELSRSE